MDGLAGGFFQQNEIDLRPSIDFRDHPVEVDGSQVAGLVGQQGLLAAGIGAFDISYPLQGIGGVDTVYEYDAGLAVVPCLFNDEPEGPSGADMARDRPVARILQREVLILLYGLHEFVGQGHGYVEIGEGRGVLLGADEGYDIGMIDIQYGHVGAASRTPLLDGLCGGVENVHEGDRSAGDACRGAHHVVARPQLRKGESGAAAALVDERHVLEGIEDLLHGVPTGRTKQAES